jgi:cellulose synthase/poly-beta-1,6-N-acetylglucosamine synthase-like glycosyltransferase
MWFKFVLVSLLLLSYNIIIDIYFLNMICDMHNDIINYYNPKQNTDIINYYNPKQNTDIINYYNAKQNNESFILKGDIEEGLGECDVCNTYNTCNRRLQIPNICKSNYFELISNMSYKIIKNMKQIVRKQVNYFCPSIIKKKMENYL